MPAYKYIPDKYHLYKTLSLSKPRTVLWMNLAAILLLLFFGRLFTYFVYLIYPHFSDLMGFSRLIKTFSIIDLALLIFSIIVMLILHELIHGIFFWLFTRERPKFALKAGYAFAAAPNWYLPRTQYILVGLSPFVIISVSFIILTLMTPLYLALYMLTIATFNAAGSLGDLIVVGWILKQPGTILVKDEGDVFSSYLPEID